MRCLAFDLDGTLITCRERQVAVAQRALADAGWLPPLDGARFWAKKREGATTGQAFVAVGVPTAVAKDAAARWAIMIEDDEWVLLDHAFPQARAALQRVKADGVAAVVLTARRNPSGPRRQLAALGLDSLIEELVVVPPATDGTEKAEALRRVSASGYIGDSELDHVSAAKASVRFAAVSCGQRSARFLEACGARRVFDDVEAAAAALLDGPDLDQGCSEARRSTVSTWRKRWRKDG